MNKKQKDDIKKYIIEELLLDHDFRIHLRRYIGDEFLLVKRLYSELDKKMSEKLGLFTDKTCKLK